jgi:hypothetical protein
VVQIGFTSTKGRPTSGPVPTPFPPRGERGYDADAVERFPWPVVAGCDDVHRWMDAGQSVHASWQLRDVWEGLIKSLVRPEILNVLST